MSKTEPKFTEEEQKLLNHIGKVISSRRKRKNLRQSDLKETLGITQVTVSRYEHGKANVPILTLKRIADTCDFRMVDYFIEYDKPSVLYKRIANPTVMAFYTQRDEEFDDYMLKPENSKKVDVLYHAAKLAENVPAIIDNKAFIDSIESSVVYNAQEHGRLDRLMTYMNGIRNMRNDINQP